MKSQVFIIPVLAVVGFVSTVSAAIAIEFKFTTVQERSSEVVEQRNIIENFRALQQERLSSPEEPVEGDVVEEDPTDTTQPVSEADVPEVSVPNADLVDTTKSQRKIQ